MRFSISYTETRGPLPTTLTTYWSPRTAIPQAFIFLCPHSGVGSASPNGGQLLAKPRYNRAGELENISVPEDDLWGISPRGLV